MKSSPWIDEGLYYSVFTWRDCHVFPFQVLVVARFYNISLGLTYQVFVSQLDSFRQTYSAQKHLDLQDAAIVENNLR